MIRQELRIFLKNKNKVQKIPVAQINDKLLDFYGDLAELEKPDPFNPIHAIKMCCAGLNFWRERARQYTENDGELIIYFVNFYNAGEVGFLRYIEKHGITWSSMINRCYNEKYYKKYTTYIRCYTHDAWHNFQNFAKWFDENYYAVNDEEMHLDKDILIKGNTIYSPETCVFVPQNINQLFLKSDKTRGEYPIGVNFRKDNGKFQARCCNNNGTREHLGFYDDPYIAFLVYKKYKENLIKQVADKYKNYIPDKLYQAMYNYVVEITD